MGGGHRRDHANPASVVGSQALHNCPFSQFHRVEMGSVLVVYLQRFSLRRVERQLVLSSEVAVTGGTKDKCS